MKNKNILKELDYYCNELEKMWFYWKEDPSDKNIYLEVVKWKNYIYNICKQYNFDLPSVYYLPL